MAKSETHSSTATSIKLEDVPIPPPAQQGATTPEYPNTRTRVLIMAALYCAVFLVTLDQNIISTAIPRITDEFNSIDDIGWYGSAYFLTMCSFQLLMGKVYKYYPAKPLFLGGVLIFEIGSAVCGSAPNSNALIVGRAIQGLGASGLFSGAFVIMFHTLPLQQRPIYMGIFGAIFALASVVGPLVGGTFTDKVTWRWCFYINLPIGAVAIAVAMLVLRLDNQKLDEPASGLLGKIRQLDPIGNLVFFPGVICLILALQWGGSTYNWGNARIIVLIILSGLFFIAFIGVQIWKQDAGLMPPRIVKQRSVAAALVFGFLQGCGMNVTIYFFPIWYQAIKGVNAVDSGLRLLPIILSVVIVSIISGIFVSKIGYYTPFFIISSVLTPIGAGLLTTLTPTIGNGKLIGYQILFGIGLGSGVQQPQNVVQTVLERPDVSSGAALVMFVRFIGPTIFLPVANNIFLNQLISRLTNLPNISPATVVNSGAIELRKLVTGDDLNTLLLDYNAAIVDVLYIGAAASAATIFASVFVEWRSLKARAAEQAGNGNKPKEASEKEKETV